MGNLIAAGFQNTVDFELTWEPEILIPLCLSYALKAGDIRKYAPIENELMAAFLMNLIVSRVTDGMRNELHIRICLREEKSLRLP